MSDPGWELQKAIYAALTGNLTAVGGGSVPIYDDVPAGAAYPYVAIDDQSVIPRDGLVQRWEARPVNGSIWSTYRGKREVMEILGQIYGLLDRQRLALGGGHRTVIVRITRQNAARDADGVTYMGQFTAEAIVERA
ncbi:MAG: DUF3168 domain-containing protein [Thalassobaculum sp.]